MSRKQQHAENRRRILSAAARLVDRDGPDALSLREVARESDYSPAGLYAYFTGRDGILAALAQRHAEDLAAALSDAPPEVHPLIDLALTWLRFARRHPGRLTLAQGHPGSEIRSVIIARVEASVSSGEVMTGPGFDVEEIADTLLAVAHGFAVTGQPEALLREGMRCLLAGLRD
ncbi:MAG: TetR/AcrR family transcriptional regulator [Myxococcota bacterium]|nr:TetR/AcrR family transcriptional regulator [Myxococcota bacterium]